MENGSLDMSLIEKEFENLILTSKVYVNGRAEEEINVMKNNIHILNQKLDAIISHFDKESDSKNLIVLRVLKKITHKLQITIPLLEEIKNYKPFCRELDIPKMVDILMVNIKSLIYYREQPINIDKLESDLQTIGTLEEQHKRVLITFLMQDWDNLKEVLNLMKVGEVYKSVAEELVHIFLLMDLLEER